MIILESEVEHFIYCVGCSFMSESSRMKNVMEECDDTTLVVKCDHCLCKIQMILSARKFVPIEDALAEARQQLLEEGLIEAMGEDED